MLAELAAANAAYSTIKTFVLNGKEITDVLSPLKNLVTAEEELRARGNRKKNGLFSKVLGKAADDFDVQPPNYVPFFNRVSGTGGLMFRAW